jgi:hypothetical protein
MPRGAERRLAHRAEVLVGVSELVGEAAAVPLLDPVDGTRVRIEQNDVRVEPQTPCWLVRPVHAVAVALARADRRQVTVPDEAVDLGQFDP